MNACIIISCVSSFVVKWHDTAAMANFQFHAKQAHHSILIVRNKNPNGVVLFWCRCLKWWRCCFVRWGVGICMFMYDRSGHYCNALANIQISISSNDLCRIGWRFGAMSFQNLTIFWLIIKVVLASQTYKLKNKMEWV